MSFRFPEHSTAVSLTDAVVAICWVIIGAVAVDAVVLWLMMARW